MTQTSGTADTTSLVSPRARVIVAVAAAAIIAAIAMFIPTAKADTLWHDPDRPYRFGLDIDPGATARVDLEVIVPVDFSAALAAGGAPGATFDTTSVRVVEVDASGAIEPGGSSVVFQFDGSDDFDATNSATGELTVLLAGNTTAARHYQLYFRDTATVGTFVPEDHSGQTRVSLLVDQIDEGRAVTQIGNAVATWYYDNSGGGFTSIVDGSDNDWVGWSSEAGSAGLFRGLPNLEHPTNEFHPGFDKVSTTIDSPGPLRVILTSTSNDGLWSLRWSFFKRHVLAEVLTTPQGADYWFQYEGTPAGSLGPEDVVITSDGTVTSHDTAWALDLQDPEWVAIADTILNRSLYVAHLSGDTAVDSYWNLNGDMTVLSFGRTGPGLAQGLTGPRSFSVGLVGGSTHGDVSTLIDRDTGDLAVATGAGESSTTPTTVTSSTVTSTTAAPPTSPTTAPPTSPTTVVSNIGYRIVTSTGRVLNYGGINSFGEVPTGVGDVVAAAGTPSGAGYWIVRSTGQVLVFGDAGHHGDITGLGVELVAPIVGIAGTPAGDGYWLLGADGGIFSFGGAGFFGSTGGLALNAPVIDMAATSTGLGYYLVALDGGIFAFGDAVFRGSTGNLVLDRPVISLALGDSGYWLVALDGGIFAFDELFLGSIPGVLAQLSPGQRPEGRRIRAIPSGTGYLIVSADGGVFAFGDANFFGSASADLAPGETAVDLLMNS